MRRIQYLSALPGRAELSDRLDPASPTGYTHAQRELILPARQEDSFHWIAQTQQMLGRNEWRVREVGYDNAPLGRAVSATSPYRWWLGLIALADHLVSRDPPGLGVERAAVLAEPLLHGLLLVAATGLVAWRFGVVAAVLFSLALAATFPLAANFHPGLPGEHGLARACALGSVLLLVVGVRKLTGFIRDAQARADGRQFTPWFSAAGMLGGVGIWVSTSTLVPVLAGVLIGALLSGWLIRRQATTAGVAAFVTAWRTWGIAGGLTTLLAFLIEYAPAHLLSWRLESVHPLYAVSWVGGVELVCCGARGMQRARPTSRIREAAIAVVAVLALACVPVAMAWTESRGFLTPDLLTSWLSNGLDATVAKDVLAWLHQDGFSARVWATALPLGVLLVAAWALVRRATPLEMRAMVALTLGPLAVAVGFACFRLTWWSTCDVLVLPLLAALAANAASVENRTVRWACACATLAFVIPGVVQLVPRPGSRAGQILASAEAELLIERDLAHWLAKRSGETGAVVYAPPRVTTSLWFYGGLRGIGTLSPDNRIGLGATVMIAGVTTMSEAQVLLEGREVRYLIVPSWDPFFDEYAQLYLAKNFNRWESVLIPSLRQWKLPPWLRPLPYQIPKIGGFENQRVLIFELVEEQNPALATSRLAEYLIEMGELEQAAAMGGDLRKYPWDIGALAARAQIEVTRGDTTALTQTLESLQRRLSGNADRFLPWDRRVSVSIVLARVKQFEAARQQVERCLDQCDAAKLRLLTTGSLYNFLVLCQAFDLQFKDAGLREIAIGLLPSGLRDRFRAG